MILDDYALWRKVGGSWLVLFVLYPRPFTIHPHTVLKSICSLNILDIYQTLERVTTNGLAVKSWWHMSLPVWGWVRSLRSSEPRTPVQACCCCFCSICWFILIILQLGESLLSPAFLHQAKIGITIDSFWSIALGCFSNKVILKGLDLIVFCEEFWVGVLFYALGIRGKRNPRSRFVFTLKVPRQSTYAVLDEPSKTSCILWEFDGISTPVTTVTDFDFP